MLPKIPGSFRASLSCSPIHLRYACIREKALSPNRLWGSWVVTLGALLGNPQIDFCSRINNLSSLCMVGREKGTA